MIRIVLSGKHYAHEVLLLAVSLIVGVAYTINSPPPTSLSVTVPHWVIIVWSGGLVISGGFGLLGCFWPRRLDVALEIERGALVIQVGALLLYTVALFAAVGWPALFSGAINVGWVIANLRRVWMISAGLHRPKRAEP